MSSLSKSLAQSLAQSLSVSIGGLRTLSFDLGIFANASERHILAQNPSTGLYQMTGPFASNVLATRNISGDTYGLFENQYATVSNYSELLSNWSALRASATDNSTTSPLGDSTAALIQEDSTPANNHQIYQAVTPDGSSRYYFCGFGKKKERYKLRLQLSGGAGFPGTPNGEFNVDDGSIIGAPGDTDDYGILGLTGVWYLCYIAATSNAAVATNCRIYLLDNDGNLSYDGDGASGLYLWGANIIAADHLTSYIKAVASPVTKAPDVFYFPSAVVPTWMKSKFTMKLIPNYDISATLGAAKTLWQCGTVVAEITATGHVLVRDGATPRVDSGAVTASMHQNLEIEFDRSNGKITTSGFTTGNGSTTDTAWTEPASDFYYGCDSGSANQADALLSTPIG